MTRRILVTSALPNANGPIHLGHLLEHVQTDIWVRFQKLIGNECYYVCADDAHGTATMLKAQAEGLTPEALIENIRSGHEADLKGFHINHDIYHSTHSEENRHFVELIYNRAKARELIFTKEIAQLYDTERKLFLADRFVIGTCPKCGEQDQYGDNCEKCGATYDAMDLIEPKSALSGAKPVEKNSEHFFFDLPQYTAMLKDWTAASVQPEVANKLSEWLDSGLKAWDISRDAPYFGFVIPGTEDKYFYVWVDAPVGYMGAFKKLCQANNEIAFDDFWTADNNTELHHFIGKDIVNFHSLFWPAMLDAAGFRKPTRVHTHGFVTVNGTKMSKSRGTQINADVYLQHLNPEYLRYYFAAKLAANTDDIDINLEDFVQRVNSDLVGKVVNIASRCAGFISKQFDGMIALELHNADLWQQYQAALQPVAELFEAGEFGKALREITALADLANQYIAQHAPWDMIKDPDKRQDVRLVCSMGINLFRVLCVMLKPVLPKMVADAEAFLNVNALVWSDALMPLADHKINKFKPLFTRMDAKKLEAVIDDSIVPDQATDSDGENADAQDTSATIELADFDKVELRVARVINAEAVEGADKLVRLTLDLGDEQREVLSGIKAAYEPASLIGRLTVVVANLAPRKMRFGTSQGMVLAAGPGGEEVFLLAPDSGAKPGMIVR